MQKPQILIYEDYVHNNGQLYHALVERYGYAAVGYCDAAAIISGILDPTVKLFVMPGGADLYYCERLNGAGNKAIQYFVENGGSYLGVCAGAYYACTAIEWAKGTDQGIIGPRELKFYSGTATGPISGFMKGLDDSWLGIATVSEDEKKTQVCYEAGPVFTEPAADNESVIARYADLPDQPPAIVSCKIGKGLVILSSPHIERQTPSLWSCLYTVNNDHYDHEHKVYKTLSKDREAQKILWNKILDRMIPTANTARHVA